MGAGGEGSPKEGARKQGAQGRREVWHVPPSQQCPAVGPGGVLMLPAQLCHIHVPPVYYYHLENKKTAKQNQGLSTVLGGAGELRLGAAVLDCGEPQSARAGASGPGLVHSSTWLRPLPPTWSFIF